MKKFNKIFSTILFVVCLLSFVYVKADDTRITISHVELTSNMEVPVYGGEAKDYYNYTTIVGNPVTMTPHMGAWYKKVDGNWEKFEGSVFKEGTYMFINQIRLDDEDGLTHKLGLDTTLIVDGVEWTMYDYAVSVYETYSMCYYRTPDYVVVNDGSHALTFTDSDHLNIYDNYVGVPIDTHDLNDAVAGGISPYTFSKVSGPSWVEVSSDGIVSGTPTAMGTNIDLVVRVTDGDNTIKEITISVGRTYGNPEDRTKIKKVELTSNLGIPSIGSELKDSYTFTTKVGAPAYTPGYMGAWFKKNGEEWIKYEEPVFTEGTYFYINQIRIDGDEGYTHVLAEDTTLIVDGNTWTTYDVSLTVDDTYSYRYYKSPEYTVVDSSKLKQTGSTTSKVTLSWGKVDGAKGYIVEVKSGKKWKKVKTITKGSTTTLTIKKLKAGTKYTYRVKAYKISKKKKKTISTTNTLVAITTPSNPKLSLSIKNYNEMNLTIAKTKGTSYYLVEKSTDNIVYNFVEKLPIHGVLSQSDQSVGKTYYFRVKACNSNDTCSKWTKVNKKQTTMPPSISLTTSKKQVTISLTTTTESEGYEVYRSTNSKKGFKLIKTVTTLEETTFVNKTKSKITYYYKVRSYKVVDGKKVYSGYSKVKKIKSK